eukprot:m.1296930 g.1296930  ORF g.1296930 m.1296930 type:complete len:611 (-) comp24795_c0_seq14:4022-5854(-)
MGQFFDFMSACHKHFLQVLLVQMLITTVSTIFPHCPPMDKNVMDAEVLFICHDAGESLGLLPVSTALYNATTGSNGPKQVAVLALGNPASTIFASNPFSMELSSFGINVTVIDRTVRNQTLPAADAAKIVECMGSVRVVVVGMVYTMQAQLAAAFAAHGRKRGRKISVIGFDDGFSDFDPGSMLGGFVTGSILANTSASHDRSSPVVSLVFVPSQFIANQITTFAITHGLNVSARVTGSPTIDTWRAAAADVAAVRRNRTAIYGDISNARPAVLYAGGYGSGYPESLRLFCQLVRATADTVSFSFSPHPGLPSHLERNLFETMNVSAYIRWLPNGTNTAVGVAASNATLSQDSTCNVQSLYIGKPSAYIQPKGTSNTPSYFTAAGLIPVMDNMSDTHAVMSAFSREDWQVNASSLVNASVPLDATALMVGAIKSLLREATANRSSRNSMTSSTAHSSSVPVHDTAVVGTTWHASIARETRPQKHTAAVSPVPNSTTRGRSTKGSKPTGTHGTTTAASGVSSSTAHVIVHTTTAAPPSPAKSSVFDIALASVTGGLMLCLCMYFVVYVCCNRYGCPPRIPRANLSYDSEGANESRRGEYEDNDDEPLLGDL